MNRKETLKFGLFLATLIQNGAIATQDVAVKSENKPNVLMIIIDDLRTELNSYGKSRVISPNIDKLSSEGITFLNAYCQKSICVPSRQSFFTGTRPDTFGSGFRTHFRTKLPDVITLPQQFTRNGYIAESIGKVFHHRDDISWSSPSWVPEPDLCYPIYRTQENIDIQKELIRDGRYVKKDDLWWATGGKWVQAKIWEAPDVEDNQLLCGMLADYAIDRLHTLRDTNFFMAVGFFSPHIPFIAPQKYYDLYPLNSISLPEDGELPIGAPHVARNPGGEWRNYVGVEKNWNLWPDEKTQKEYIRGYLASVSFVDAQVGKLLKALEDLNLAENTIVILFSDHGYHLFDKATFGKNTNFENGTRVPLIIRQPNNENSGKKTKAIVELLDIYPTLCEMAGLSIPSHLQGKSFVESLVNPSTSVGKEAAFSQFARGGYKGCSVRTDRYRYTEWRRKTEILYELYDYELDPGETMNRIDDPMYKDEIAKLSNLLDQVFPNP